MIDEYILNTWDDYYAPLSLETSPVVSKGRLLTENDVNKSILRVKGFLTDAYKYENSYVLSDIKKIDSKSVIFKGFHQDKDGVKLILGNLSGNEDWVCYFANYNDGNWITVDEVKQKLSLKDWIELYKRNLLL